MSNALSRYNNSLSQYNGPSLISNRRIDNSIPISNLRYETKAASSVGSAGGLSFIKRAVPILAAIGFGANFLNRAIDLHRSNIQYAIDQSSVNNSATLANFDSGFYDVSQALSARATIEDAESFGTVSTPTDVDQPELYADNARQVQLSILTAPDAVIRNAIGIFQKYGYMINRPMVPSRLDPMTAFSYWQTNDTTIVGSMPAIDREQLISEFEAGVTVWENMGQIGTNPSNSPRTGISY